MRFLYTTLVSFFLLLSIQGINAQCLSGNCYNGDGTYKWVNGDMYVGAWADSSRTGYGRYDWADGSYYVGNFKDNFLDGNGSYFAADGTSMIGEFRNNNFIPPSETTDTEMEGDESLSELLAQWDAQSEADSLSKVEAFNISSKEDFCSVAGKLIEEFPYAFSKYKGPAQVGLLNLGDSWYSLIMVENSLEAGITSGFTSSGSFYNILFEGQDFDDAKRRYDGFVSQMMECRTACCTMIYNPYEYKSDSYTSYSTSWLTFMVNEGYNEEIYNDLVIEIELMSQIVDNGWQIVFRMYHLSDVSE